MFKRIERIVYCRTFAPLTRMLLRSFIYTIICLAAATVTRTAFATIGLAEWEVKTPGGNMIASTDPFKEKSGTALFAGIDLQGATPVIEHIEWWQYYPGFIAGKARSGFFLFSEANVKVEFFEQQSSLAVAIQKLAHSKALSEKMTSQEGWEQAWLGATCSNPHSHHDIVNAKSEEQKRKVHEQLSRVCNEIRREKELNKTLVSTPAVGNN